MLETNKKIEKLLLKKSISPQLKLKLSKQIKALKTRISKLEKIVSKATADIADIALIADDVLPDLNLLD